MTQLETHVSYPHYPGRLYDCPACEASCHCVAGEPECVFDGSHNGLAIPEPVAAGHPASSRDAETMADKFTRWWAEGDLA